MPRAARDAAEPQHVSDLSGIVARLRELVA
jgi:hypothetical protein